MSATTTETKPNEIKPVLATLAKMLITDIQQVGLQFNLGDLESLNLKPDGTCEAIFPTARLIYAWDGTVIKCYARGQEEKKG